MLAATAASLASVNVYPAYVGLGAHGSGLAEPDTDQPKDQTMTPLEIVDVPADISRLTTADVGRCLRQLHLESYVEAFIAADVDGSLLRSLDEEILMESFTMTKIEARKLMMFALHGWRPNRGN
jgi:hypothetical protein